MARRFNYEPINLIHRIPTPQQMDAARPSGPSLGQTLGRVLVKAGGVCWRKALELIKHVTRHEDEATVGRRVIRALPPPYNYVNGINEETSTNQAIHPQVYQRPTFSPLHVKTDGTVRPMEVLPRDEEKSNPPSPQFSTVAAGAREEEVTALRSYLLGQQQDIASLTAQIRELKSLVSSQQQVLVHLGEEMETGSFPTVAGRSAAAAPRRDRIIRDKPLVKENAIPHNETDSPSLNL